MDVLTIMVLNYLLLKGVCKDISSAMIYKGPEKERADRLASGIIRILNKHCVDPHPGTANLELGVRNTPFKQQYSLWVLKRKISIEHVFICMRYVLLSLELNGNEEKDILFAYNVVRPLLIVIDRDFSEAEILSGFDF